MAPFLFGLCMPAVGRCLPDERAQARPGVCATIALTGLGPDWSGGPVDLVDSDGHRDQWPRQGGRRSSGVACGEEASERFTRSE